MADAVDLKSNVERREGSNPSAGTFYSLEITMDAKRCDRCGEFYLEQDVIKLKTRSMQTPRTIGISNLYEPEKIQVMGISFKPEFNDNRYLLSLCPRCYEDLFHWYFDFIRWEDQ